MEREPSQWACKVCSSTFLELQLLNGKPGARAPGRGDHCAGTSTPSLCIRGDARPAGCERPRGPQPRPQSHTRQPPRPSSRGLLRTCCDT